MLNVAMLLDDSTREYPDRTAIVCEGARLSYAQLNAAANQVANGLVQAGIKKGDTVGLTCGNVPYFPIVYYGILKAGAVVMPMNVLYKSREIAYNLTDSDARAYFCLEGSPELPIGQQGYSAFKEVAGCKHFFLMTNNPTAQSSIPGTKTLAELMHGQPTTFETVPTNGDDTAVIIYTSGTTGKPKGAELTHSNMIFNARLCDILLPRADHDVLLIPLPLFHVFGQSSCMNTGIYLRATLILQPRFSPEDALRLMEQENVTIFEGVPTMYWA